MKSGWVRMFTPPKVCRWKPKDALTPQQRYRLSQSRRRYDATEDGAAMREMITAWVKGGMKIGYYSGVVIHEDLGGRGVIVALSEYRAVSDDARLALLEAP